MEWNEQLEHLLGPAQTVIVMGIGNEMMGDDAAGVLLVRELKKLVPAALPGKRIHLFECHTTPENFTGALARISPDLVLLVDSAEMGAAEGEIRMLDAASMGSMMHSTHTMPLSFLAGYIERTTKAKVIACGIQAGHILLDRPMSRPVAASVKLAARLIAKVLCGDNKKPGTINRRLRTVKKAKRCH